MLCTTNESGGAKDTILKYLTNKNRILLVVCALIVLLQVFLELEIPKHMEDILEYPEGTSFFVIMDGEGYPMIACAFLSLACALVSGYIAAIISSSFGKTIRKKEYEKIQTFSATEINRFTADSLLTRTTNDVSRVQTLIGVGAVVLVRAPVMAILAFTDIVSKENFYWTVSMSLTILFIAVYVFISMRYAMPRFRKAQMLTDSFNRLSRENLMGMRVVRAFNAEGYHKTKFDETNEAFTENSTQAMCMLTTVMPMLTAVMGILTVTIFFIGAILINEYPSSASSFFGQMIVFSQYAYQIIMSIIMLVIVLMNYPRAVVSAKRIEEVLDTEPSIANGDAKEGMEGHEGEIEFRNVSFRYPGSKEDTLTDISFTARKGETVAIIGPIGSGKTTIINLITRSYVCSSGTILIDGVDITDYDMECLNAKYGYVPQKSKLFKGSIDSNIRFGQEGESRSDDDLKLSVRISQAEEFVSRLDGSTDSPVSQGGMNLSGGQKQRISIARAICRKPEFYLFDDSFSALDYRTDRVLRETLKRETSGVTTIIVAQRIGTIRHADRIIVIENGRIAGIGKHSELMTGCKLYRDIALSQMSEEELVR